VPIWQPPTPIETPEAAVKPIVAEASELEDATRTITLSEKSRNVVDEKAAGPRRKSSNIRNEIGDFVDDFAALPNSKLEQVISGRGAVVKFSSLGNTYLIF
jgi:hypothetical protein